MSPCDPLLHRAVQLLHSCVALVPFSIGHGSFITPFTHILIVEVSMYPSVIHRCLCRVTEDPFDKGFDEYLCAHYMFYDVNADTDLEMI